jgi:hypothetical protein
MRWLDHHQAGLRVRGVPMAQRMCAQVLAGIDPLLAPANKTGPYPGPRYTVDQMRSGVAAWPIRSLSNPLVDIEWNAQFQKVGWSVDVSAQYFEDDGYERMLRYIWDEEDKTDEEFVEFATKTSGSQSFYTNISNLSGGKWYDGYDNNTYLVATLARMVNRYS